VAAPNRGLATGGFAWGNIKELKFLFYIKKPISWIFQTSGVADLQSAPPSEPKALLVTLRVTEDPDLRLIR
jgi:hypothetical protein